METLRGNFAGRAALVEEREPLDTAEDDAANDTPPGAVGQDERRMQVRAYNHWASLLGEHNFPSIDLLDPEALPDFGPFSVLLDFTAGIENPGVTYLGAELAKECDAGRTIARLSDIPSRSLLSRITDHYMQILANQAPIGFEAEFVNQRGRTILYRGILLPFSSDDQSIDFIYGVINWKELADQQATDELLLQIDQALDDAPGPGAGRSRREPIIDWADGPGSEQAVPGTALGGVLDFTSFENAKEAGTEELPRPHFGYDEVEGSPFGADLAFGDDAPFEHSDEADMGLGDLLALARDLAEAACRSEERSRNALYDAVSRAYDVSLAAAREPEEFRELLENAGLTVQKRAPMTPVVKLVFGADYDKTRLTEYAAALSHAHRLELAAGTLGEFLRRADGGLKGVVKAERKLRREEAGRAAADGAPRERIAAKLRDIEPAKFDTIAPVGAEFGLVLIRRLPTGEVVSLGEVPEDDGLVDRAARRLLA